MAIFPPPLAGRLAWIFWPLGLAALDVGVLMTRGIATEPPPDPAVERPRRDPIEMISALGFAAVFLAVLVATRVASERFGAAGVLTMAAIMGVADVDPFILGVTQTPNLDLATAALAILIAAAVNNLANGVYAVLFGSRPVGGLAFALLAGWGAASVALWMIVRGVEPGRCTGEATSHQRNDPKNEETPPGRGLAAT